MRSQSASNRRVLVGIVGGLLFCVALNVYSYNAHFHAPARYHDEIAYFGLPFRIYYSGWAGSGILWPGAIGNLLVAIAAGGGVAIWRDEIARDEARLP